MVIGMFMFRLFVDSWCEVLVSCERGCVMVCIRVNSSVVMVLSSSSSRLNCKVSVMYLFLVWFSSFWLIEVMVVMYELCRLLRLRL